MKNRSSTGPYTEMSTKPHLIIAPSPLPAQPGPSQHPKSSLLFWFADTSLTSMPTLEVVHDYTQRLYSLEGHRKKEKERSLEIGVESHRLMRGFINKVSYCHSCLKRREKILGN